MVIKMKENLTIPNVISLLRICIIPVFISLYFSDKPDHYVLALIVIVLSAVTDVVDGFIARKFNMVSDVGKVLDPIADKLTQISVVFCLLFAHRNLIIMVVVLFTKELLTLFAAIYILRGGFKPISAKWFGKLATVVVYLTFFYAIYMDINPVMPMIVLDVLSIASTVCLLISMAGYIKVFLKTDSSDK